MLDFLRNLFTYDAWAISRSLSSLDDSESSKARLMLSHVLIAEKIWLLRLRGEDSSHVSTFKNSRSPNAPHCRTRCDGRMRNF